MLPNKEGAVEQTPAREAPASVACRSYEVPVISVVPVRNEKEKESRTKILAPVGEIEG